MLALELLEGVPHRPQEVLVRRQDVALEVELDDGLGPVDGLHAAGELGVLHGVPRDVDGVLDDLQRPALGVQDRVVGGLDEHVLTGLRDPAVGALVEVPASELLPEALVLRRHRVHGVDEQAVVLTDDLGLAVPEQSQEVLVRGEHRPVETELDDGLGPVDGGDAALQLDRAAGGAGDVVGVLDDPDDLAVRPEDGVVGRADADLLAAGAVPRELAGLRAAGAQAAPERDVVRAGGVGGVAEHAVVLPHDVVRLVPEEVQGEVVGAEHDPVGRQLDHGLGALDGAGLAAQVPQLGAGDGDVGQQHQRRGGPVDPPGGAADPALARGARHEGLQALAAVAEQFGDVAAVRHGQHVTTVRPVRPSTVEPSSSTARGHACRRTPLVAVHDEEGLALGEQRRERLLQGDRRQVDGTDGGRACGHPGTIDVAGGRLEVPGME